MRDTRVTQSVAVGARGSGMVEAAVGVAIIVAVFVGLITAYNSFVAASRANTRALKAVFLLDEGLNALRLVRADGWDSFSALPTGAPQYLSFTGGAWTVGASPEFIDGFERSFTLEEVARDGNDDIAESGTADDGTRKATVSVSWAGATGTTTRTLEAYLTKLIE